MYIWWYTDSARNILQENCSIFSLIRVR